MNLLRFAFVACNKNPQRFMSDPSFIYRCENLALALQALGHNVELMHYTQLRDYGQYDVVIFHRPSDRLFFRWFINKLRRKSCLLIADVDDLIFDPQYANVSPGVVNQLVTLQQTVTNFRANAKALACFDRLTTSTLPLMQQLQRIQPESQILLLPNTAHLSWHKLDSPPSVTEKEKILTYFPGTRSHDKDFASISAVLAEFLHQHPDIKLHITGVLNCQLSCRPEQFTQLEKVPFAEYARHVAKSWVNLAPLELNEFNQHKSGIKAIEAAFFNAPTLATPIPDMQRLADSGALLAYTADDWFTQLCQLCEPDYYHQQSWQLKEKSQQKANIMQQAQRFLEFTDLL
ncbi:glycosyltransferase [Rheinheimera soli]|uniref:Glycosyltransferase family 1 protein n=1 Tax=Rheinheimera soli TaxID=443616 RepID=A0ABU1VU92_9GAMM|nr:glycosyltransferase [Rheinheimera soli]MDR7119285.1 hypothetical protein [Rheinheimera soli]